MRSGRRYTTADGTPTTGVFSTMNSVLHIINKIDPTHVVTCYDAGGNARKEGSDTYKANRSPLSGDFITESRILLDEAMYAMGIECIGLRGIEADDIIHTLAEVAHQGLDQFDEVIIATVDQDLLQCVTDRCKVLLFNSAKKQVMMGEDEVVEKWGCEPDDIKYVKALSGDASDNIKGVPGVGPKTALKILRDADWNIEAAIHHPKVREHDAEVRENLSLVTLRNVTGVLGPFSWSDYELGKGLESDLTDFFTKYEMASSLKRLEAIKTTLRVKS